MLGNLFKAAVGVVLTPVAVVVDVVSLPATSVDLRRGPFDNTSKVVSSVGRNLSKVLDIG